MVMRFGQGLYLWGHFSMRLKGFSGTLQKETL